MAVTNKQIIATYKAMNELESETIHTYARWRQLGFCVKKGEKSQHKISVWKPVSFKSQDDDGNEVKTSKLILKASAFFTSKQVEKICQEE